MILRDLLEQFNKLVEEEPTALDLPVYGTIGSSGVSYKLGYPNYATMANWRDGDVLELDEGDKFVDLYLGN